jgi:hypothetical protein
MVYKKKLSCWDSIRISSDCVIEFVASWTPSFPAVGKSDWFGDCGDPISRVADPCRGSHMTNPRVVATCLGG